MQSARTHIVDVTESYAVIDPNAFPSNLGYTAAEDTPTKTLPILAFEGVNFLPTAYGYRSFFGTNSLLDIAPLAARCDRVLSYQFADYSYLLIALCEDGIWTCFPSTIGAPWVHSVVQTVPPTGTYSEFTYAVIANVVYFYRQGDSLVWKLTPLSYTPTLTFTSFTPTFLNMAGQMGIFHANGRLGFWDSANSIAWSNASDHTDFTPSLLTLAGNAQFNGVLGRIVTIKAQGQGFIIYCTKSVVGVHYLVQGAALWEANTILENAGIDYDKMVTAGITDLEHYVYTNMGIKKIGAYNIISKEQQVIGILPDVYDLLAESRQPVYLEFINGRYLVFHQLDNAYIDGKASFTLNTINPSALSLRVNGVLWDGVTYIPPTAFAGMTTTELYNNAVQWWSTSLSGALEKSVVPYSEIGFPDAYVTADAEKQKGIWQADARARQRRVDAWWDKPSVTTDKIYKAGVATSTEAAKIVADATAANGGIVNIWRDYIVTGTPAILGPVYTDTGTHFAQGEMTMVASGGRDILETREKTYYSQFHTGSVIGYNGTAINYGGLPVAEYTASTLEGVYQAFWDSNPDTYDLTGYHYYNKQWLASLHGGDRSLGYDYHSTSDPLYILHNGGVLDLYTNSIKGKSYDIHEVITIHYLIPIDTSLSLTRTWTAEVHDLKASAYSTTMTYATGGMPYTPPIATLPVDTSITFPGASFLIQSGLPAPIYPSYVGALVFDVALGKWGKLKATYSTLIDYTPINALVTSLSYTKQGIDGGILQTGAIKSFDANPVESWMRWGKIGVTREGMTKLHTVAATFRQGGKGTVEVDTSLDGISLDPDLHTAFSFASVGKASSYLNNIGKYHTITLRGTYDLQGLEFRSSISSRR